MKEIQAVLSGINTHILDFKELRKEICEGVPRRNYIF